MPTPSPHLQTIDVPSLSQRVEAARYHLPVDAATQVAVWVDNQTHDGITDMITSGTYALLPHFQLLPRLRPRVQRVLDLGAHIGTFALYAAALGCAVTAIDASPINTALLKVSLLENGFTNFYVIEAAVSDRPGRLDFLVGGPYGLVKNAFISSPTISVPALRVDDVLAQVGWETADFIKMDIEGSEVAAVKGMHKLLSRNDAPLILFESNGHTLHMFGESPSTLLAEIGAYGYQFYLVDGERLAPVQAGDFQPECVVDYLAVKRPLPELTELIRQPLSFTEVVAKIIASASYPHHHIRTHIARALSQPNAEAYLSHPQVIEALEILSNDQNPKVQVALEWWAAAKTQASPAKTSAPRPRGRVLEKIRSIFKRLIKP